MCILRMFEFSQKFLKLKKKKNFVCTFAETLRDYN